MIVVGLACAAAVLVLRPTSRRSPTPAGASTGERPRRQRRADLPGVLLEVAAQLTVGASPTEAWARAMPPGDGLREGLRDGAPTVEGLMALDPGSGGDPARCTSVVVAVESATRLGAPLADVLQRLAGALAADQEAAAEVRAAVAGPRATARVLAWLPVLGTVVAMALGAEPVAVMLGGGLGTAAAAVGVVLLVAGRLWTRALLRRAVGAV